MEVDRAIDITAEERKTVLSLLQKHIPNTTVWVYGSRAKWTSQPQSDLDLVVFLTENQRQIVGDLQDDFEQSNLPFRVDLFVWEEVPDLFRRQIEADHLVLIPAIDVRDPVHPKNWKSMPFTEAFLINPPVPIERGSKTPFIEMAAINPSLRSVTSTHLRTFRGSGSRFQSGDTLMARITPCLENGKIARYYASTDCAVGHGSTEFIVIRGRPEVSDSGYAFYVTRSDPVRYYAIDQMTGTSGRQRVPTESLRHLNVAVPPLSEQRAITHVLSTLDDKIELNRRMNETLEAAAQTLFKSWFVDFDPVRAKMEGRDTGLPHDIADLFPDRLMDSEIGEIPENWKVFRLDDLANQHTKSTSPFRFLEVEYEHFSIPAYDAGRRPAIERGAAIRSNKTIVIEDAVLLSKLNPTIARVWIPCNSTGRSQVCSTEFLVFTPRPPVTRSLLFTLFSDQRFRALLKSLVTGTSRSHQRVPPKALRIREVLAGSPIVFAMFGEMVDGMLARVLRNRAESATLAALRDTILPKLISGEVRVPYTGRAVESVT